MPTINLSFDPPHLPTAPPPEVVEEDTALLFATTSIQWRAIPFLADEDLPVAPPPTTIGGESGQYTVIIISSQLPRFGTLHDDESLPFEAVQTIVDDEVLLQQITWPLCYKQPETVSDELLPIAEIPPDVLDDVVTPITVQHPRRLLTANHLYSDDVLPIVPPAPTTLGGEAGQYTIIVGEHNGRFVERQETLDDDYPSFVPPSFYLLDESYTPEKQQSNWLAKVFEYDDLWATPPPSAGLDEDPQPINHRTRIPWRLRIFLGGDIGVRIMPFDDERYEPPRQIVLQRFSSFLVQEEEPKLTPVAPFFLLDEEYLPTKQNIQWVAAVFSDDEARIDFVGPPPPSIGGHVDYTIITLSRSGRFDRWWIDDEQFVQLQYDDDIRIHSMDQRITVQWTPVPFLSNDVEISLLILEDEWPDIAQRIGVQWQATTFQNSDVEIAVIEIEEEVSNPIQKITLQKNWEYVVPQDDEHFLTHVPIAVDEEPYLPETQKTGWLSITFTDEAVWRPDPEPFFLEMEEFYPIKQFVIWIATPFLDDEILVPPAGPTFEDYSAPRMGIVFGPWKAVTFMDIDIGDVTLAIVHVDNEITDQPKTDLQPRFNPFFLTGAKNSYIHV